MPPEVLELAAAPAPLTHCPRCKAPFEPFLRGQVQRSPWPWWAQLLILPCFFLKPRPYCAVICRACKQIVGYE